MTYSEIDLLPTANIILNYVLEPIQHQSLYKKYASKRYLKVSCQRLLSLPPCSFPLLLSTVQRVHEALGVGAMARKHDCNLGVRLARA